MSIQHVAAVLDCRDERLYGCKKLALVALANRTDQAGQCWPSQGLLAGECGISVRAISEHLKALEDDGFITRNTRHLGRGSGSTTVYTLRLSALKNAPEDFAPANIAPAKTGECTGSTLRVKSNHHESSSSYSGERAEIIDRILAVCGPGMVDHAKVKRPIVDLASRLDRWLEKWDLEQDILPAVEEKTADRRPSPMRDFRFVEEHIALFHGRRVSPLPEFERRPRKSQASQGDQLDYFLRKAKKA